jgi:hypothetical protein
MEGPHPEPVRYIAAAALPYLDRERAAVGLRGQLRLMALAAAATPEWSTLTVTGPTEMLGDRGRTWFEWTATVEVAGGEHLVDASIEALMAPLLPGARMDTTQPKP